MRIRFFPNLSYKDILDRKVWIARQYNIEVSGEMDLYEFFYLSSSAMKMYEDKVQASKEGKILIV